MTKAGFMVGGELIDQKTYFRDVVFGDLHWAKVSVDPEPEVFHAAAPCEVIVLGENLGVHDLPISHKPAREADQENYTTALHWNQLMKPITERNIVGRTLRLYRPAAPGGNFRIEIV